MRSSHVSTFSGLGFIRTLGGGPAQFPFFEDNFHEVASRSSRGERKVGTSESSSEVPAERKVEGTPHRYCSLRRRRRWTRGCRARGHEETGPEKIAVQPETAGGVGANQPVGSDAKQAFIKRIARPPWGHPGIFNGTRVPVAIEICSAPPTPPAVKPGRLRRITWKAREALEAHLDRPGGSKDQFGQSGGSAGCREPCGQPGRCPFGQPGRPPKTWLNSPRGSRDLFGQPGKLQRAREALKGKPVLQKGF